MSEDNKDLQQVNNQRQQRPRHHRVRNFILVIVAIIVVGAGAYVGYAWHKLSETSKVVYQPSGAPKLRNASQVISKKKPVSILLLGADTGAAGRSYKGRTDTIIVMTINPKTNQSTMVSLPRDMKVNLPGYAKYSPAKINAAYTYGGIKETISTVQKYLNVPIDYYLMVNMGGLKKAINKVGGVDVISPLSFHYSGSTFKKGQKYHLNGSEALKFSRMRYDDPRGDYGRQERQRLVLSALLKKSISYKTVLNDGFLVSISDEMQTDLTRSDMLGLALNYRSAGKNANSDHAQGKTEMQGGQSYEVVPSKEKVRISNELRTSLGLNSVGY
ncbi:LytR family transcriptional regulator [Secundilactobacillus pentosiphilus]|uniref:LytR family transcriptional regulator n=1 Tax=Secundilactobacillus pentosiphilus TaxID=1714682 RepID=A0A1Z5IU45_9LACO|nr:LCP family protein [Secundilactobacillus pentosiphilus]GAX05138.1 LytR family transcriptional regulator [Secundilactobacillus pentosiphilus]